jgi:hypothetical protein
MKLLFAKIALGLSLFLFFTGFLLLCSCPGWYATCAVFAFVAAILGTARVRFWSTLCLLASIAWTVIHYELKIADDERFRGIRLNVELLLKQSHNGK